MKRQARKPRSARRMRRALVLVVAHFVVAVSVQAADESLMLMVHGMARTSLVHVPDRAAEQSEAALPLVLAFHGSTWNASVMREVTGFDAVAEREGFVVVYPNGTGPGDVFSWNAGECCSFAMAYEVDDIGFVAMLIDELVTRYPVDPDRIYACGFSNGAMLVHKLGLALGERFAAIAAVGGAMYGNPEPISISLPVLIIHGTNDRVVPYDGGWGTLAELSGKTEPGRSAQFAVDFWRQSNGCQGLAAEQIVRNTMVRRYGGCSDEAEVSFYSVIGAGHVWPVVTWQVPSSLIGNPTADLLPLISSSTSAIDGDSPGVSWELFESGIDATQVIWEFFQRHARGSSNDVVLD